MIYNYKDDLGYGTVAKSTTKAKAAATAAAANVNDFTSTKKDHKGAIIGGNLNAMIAKQKPNYPKKGATVKSEFADLTSLATAAK